MDIRAIQQTVAATEVASSAVRAVAPVAAAPEVPPQVQQFVSQISQSSAMAPEVKAEMIDTAAMIEEFVNNPEGRQAAYKDLAGLGVYLSRGERGDYPKWSVLTGLRFFGGATAKLSIEAPKPEPRVAAQRVQQKMEAIAQNHARVSMAQVRQEVQRMPDAPQKIEAMVGHTVVQTKSEGMGRSRPDEKPTVVKTA
ncbi:MAG: hypothetical protein WAX89_01985 [Alphaproteobacteria bacterium]